jgi:hypothetical protein
MQQGNRCLRPARCAGARLPLRRSYVVRAQQAQIPPPQRPPTGMRDMRIGPSAGPSWSPPFAETQAGGGGGGGNNNNNNEKKDQLNNYAKALIAGAFVCGLGVGVRFCGHLAMHALERVSCMGDAWW